MTEEVIETVEIEETKGGADSNSYASIEEADALLFDMFGTDEWFAQSDDNKSRLLITATRMIDRLPVIYQKADSAQNLKFPVANTSPIEENTGDGFAQAKDACIYQALYLLTYGDAIREAKSAQIRGITSESFGKVSKSTSGFNYLRQWSAESLRLLGKFIDMSFKIRRY